MSSITRDERGRYVLSDGRRVGFDDGPPADVPLVQTGQGAYTQRWTPELPERRPGNVIGVVLGLFIAVAVVGASVLILTH